MTPDRLPSLALRAGATELGSSEGTQHYIFSAEQLARFVELVGREVPPPPY